jgi:sporulation-control protein spo0M
MSFSEKMRDSLGAEGVRLEVQPPASSLVAGNTAEATVTMRGGTKPARVDALTVRIVEADRHWLSESGARIDEEEAQSLADRRHLTAGWDRRTAGERRIALGCDVAAGSEETVAVAIEVPADCKPTSVSRAHTLNVQADIKGQIDPTGNARIVVTAAPAESG